MLIFGVLLACIILAYGAVLLRIVGYEYEMQRIYREKSEDLQDLTRSMAAPIEDLAIKRNEIKKEYEQAIGILYRRQRRLLKAVPYFRRAYL